MEQIKVSDLATEFQIQYTVVISELKKIGVWVPSADTPVDPDIAIRIRRRLQLIAEVEQETEKAKDKRLQGVKAKKTIKELGKPRKVLPKKAEEKPAESALAASLKPRRGKGVYRRADEEVSAELQPQELIPTEPELEEVPSETEAEVEASSELAVPEAVETPAEIEAAGEPAAVETKPAGDKETPEPVPAAEAPATTPSEPAPTQEQPVAQAATPEHPPATHAKAPEAPTGEKPAVHAEAPAAEAKPAEPEREKPVILKRTAPTPPPPVQPITRQFVRPPQPGHQQRPYAGQQQRRFDQRRPQPKPKERRPVVAPPPPVVREHQDIVLSESVSVKELSERLNVKSKDVLRELLTRGIMAGINHRLDQKTAIEIAAAFNATPRFVTYEESVMEQDRVVEKETDVTSRAPVVTVMGHVDHGKTSLLDAIRKTKVAAGEAGGITQHIGAYHVSVNDRRIVFLDTPGHEAFTMMRARGAKATDIVVLVVAADDGVMPQTVEAINHARAAGVPILVAINKVDKPEADVERVRRELSNYNLLAEDWGGDTVMVEVSAREKTNLDLLLEMILLLADMLELKANPQRPATGVILEARLDKGRGAVATVLIQNGTLRVGDSFIAGAAYGKIRAMFDDRGDVINVAGPSSAVEVLGLQSLPQAGDSFQVVDDTIKARQIGEYRQGKLRDKEMVKTSRVSLDELYAQMQAGEVKELPVVLKGDAQGSVEVLEDSLQKLGTDKVKVRIIHRGVGAISESDVLLASASNAVVIGFNVRPEQNAQAAAEHEEVDVRLYTVIYDLQNELKQAMLGLLEPTIKENYQGKAEVRQTFKVPKAGTVAGSYVLDGTIARNSEIRLLRDNVVVYEGKISSLRRFKEDVPTVKAGYECGISIANYNDIKVGDVIEAFVKERVEPQLA